MKDQLQVERPRPRPPNSSVKTFSLTSMEPEAQPMHLSTTRAVVVLPPALMVMVLPHMGLPLDWVPICSQLMATRFWVVSSPELSTPQEPRPTV